MAGRVLPLLLAVTALGAGVAMAAPRSAGADPGPRPNVLVIVADDQTAGTVTPAVMPTAHQRFVQEGRSYPNFTVATPLCCPSRASIMTGRYNHSNGVLTNNYGQPRNLDQRSTIQCYLRRAGYRTGLYGKFFNNFPVGFNPPCLDDWATTPGQQHDGVRVNVNGAVSLPPGYADDLTLERAISFIEDGEQRDRQPWYAYFSSTYPHSPYRARAEHAETVFPIPPEGRSPALDEVDVSDKPAFVRRHMGPGTPGGMQEQLRMLATVDDQVRALFDALERTGELDRTVVVYVSDNGYLFGEHGLHGKRLPYTEAIRVPFFIRYPKLVPPASVDGRFAENIDIMPTLLEMTRVTPRLRYPLDGRSLLGRSRRPFSYNEHFRLRVDRNPAHWQPSWRSLRTRRYQYIEWLRLDGRVRVREYYDLVADPHQLVNLFGDADPANDPDVRRLHEVLLAQAACRGRTCR